MRKLQVVLVSLILLFSSICFADTHYLATDGTDTGTCDLGNDCLTLQYAMSQMASDDTLEIAAGTYTGAGNVIDSTHYPPAGSGSGTFTIIKAATDGTVFFDGEDTRQMFVFLGTAGGSSYIDHWKFQGIQWVRSSGYGVQITSGTAADDFSSNDYGANLPDNYVFFKNCGFHGAANSVAIFYAKYFLFEDCWTWGNGRYGYLIETSDYVVVRRNVDRRQAVIIDSSVPSASYINYASHYVSFQNCISIDVDTTDNYDADADPYGAFYIRETYSGAYGSRNSENTTIYGSIIVNYNSTGASPYFAGIFTKDTTVNSVISNVLILGSSNGIIVNNLDQNVTFDHVTVINAQNEAASHKYAFEDWGGGSLERFVVTNSAAVNNSFLTAYTNIANTSDYNGAYGNLSDTIDQGSNNVSTNPAIVYPVAIPIGSSYDNAASDAGDIGATILYKMGTDGTFYGDSGYATITANKIWPWPNESTIRTAFRNDYSAATEIIGFTLNGDSLTNYIIDSLGANIITVTGTTSTTTDQLSVDAFYADVLGVDEVLPTLSSASVNGSNVSVVFTESVTVNTVGTWTMDCDGDTNYALTYQSGSGTNTLAFTSATAATNGQTCDITFVGGANYIEDDAGNDLADFADQAMTNNTPAEGVPYSAEDNAMSSSSFDTYLQSGLGDVLMR